MNKVISFVSSPAVQIYDFHVRYIVTVQELDCTLLNLSHQISGLFVSKYVIHVVFLIFTASNCGQDWHAYKSGCLRLFKDHEFKVGLLQKTIVPSSVNQVEEIAD